MNANTLAERMSRAAATEPLDYNRWFEYALHVSNAFVAEFGVSLHGFVNGYTAENLPYAYTFAFPDRSNVTCWKSGAVTFCDQTRPFNPMEPLTVDAVQWVADVHLPWNNHVFPGDYPNPEDEFSLRNDYENFIQDCRQQGIETVGQLVDKVHENLAKAIERDRYFVTRLHTENNRAEIERLGGSPRLNRGVYFLPVGMLRNCIWNFEAA